MTHRVLMIGTFDTKSVEYAFLYERLVAFGCEVLAMNAGVDSSTDMFPIAIEADEVATAGGTSLAEIRDQRDRGQAISVLSTGAAVIARKLFDAALYDGVIGMGGSGGTGIVTAAMRTLPLGVPKLCVSTLAAGDVAMFVGTKDIVMLPSIVDVAGINRISRMILTQAAGAMVGMLAAKVPPALNDRPLIGATMFGNTTRCVDACRAELEQHGYEVLVFHATGTGGRVMESLADERLLDGVLDITTTEWADELCGGTLGAGPDRLSAPGRQGIPHLIVPGCVDMCNFRGMNAVPPHYRNGDRLFYEWSPAVALMRTTADENRRMGEIFAEKANAAMGPVAFLFPLKGVSVLDADGGQFCDRVADQAFFDAVKQKLRPGIDVIEIDVNINDPEFSSMAVTVMRTLLRQRSS